MGKTYADAMRRNAIYNTDSQKKGRTYGDIYLEPETKQGKEKAKQESAGDSIKGLKSAASFFGFGKKK